ncbi:hypothetical protein GCM10025865_30690 [Paraoerskovia sediminicola]|uniref:UDP-N-acetylmuramyl pentapeptide phosphotransferase/UDP-N-acetylglucosamine-1-phosphate transferase n=1 Tax=Paraoerskovia sediminicola TaxID=1138587 RepID=A0ABN6XJF6_9CELL|nr:hypothetical protein [Paraoerskovia sediminicola]BDZ43770.1 hypothetical protein GCM10025865_30690 [Paraoerskovia sediminicola]
MTLGSVVAGATVSAGTTAAARTVLDAAPPGGAARWTRTNHRGEPISMLEGPAVVVGLAAGAIAGAGTTRSAAAAAVAVVGAGAFGVVDDLAEDTSERTKGLKGHLGALAHGRLTTGGLKVLGIGATSLVAAAIATPTDGHPVLRSVDVVLGGALVAASANLLNLFDLRPGRALKVATLGALAGTATGEAGLSGAVVGSAGAAAGADLAERDMLGDGGANALGALLGVQVVLGASRAVRVAALAGVVGLTLASEKTSFSAVIDGNPVLRLLDGWGRRPRRR